MKKLLNVLYVTLPDAHMSLEDENVLVKRQGEVLLKVPLLNLEGIISFSYFGATPQLMSKCAQMCVSVSFLSEYGKYLGTLYGETKGNVLLRREQYRIADSLEKSLPFAQSFIFAKLHNQRWVLERGLRDHALRVNTKLLETSSAQILENQKLSLTCQNKDILRAIEGNAAQAYFRAIDELILQNKKDFLFIIRNRRPPTDPINALLSFAYTLLAAECRHALESVGLDSYVGFMHTDRPGRASLALDLMEELRPHFADRFVLTMINRNEISPDDFEQQVVGAVKIKSEARKKFLTSWQQRKREHVTHPFLEEEIQWGLVPHVQALLLSKAIRGDLESYPPFLWK